HGAEMGYSKRSLGSRIVRAGYMNKTLEGFGQSVYRTMWGPSEFTATGSLSTYERGEQLKALNLPVLFTAGRYDEATPSTTAYYQSLIPGAKLRIFENSAHVTMQDEPAAYVRAVRDSFPELDSR